MDPALEAPAPARPPLRAAAARDPGLPAARLNEMPMRGLSASRYAMAPAAAADSRGRALPTICTPSAAPHMAKQSDVPTSHSRPANSATRPRETAMSAQMAPGDHSTLPERRAKNTTLSPASTVRDAAIPALGAPRTCAQDTTLSTNRQSSDATYSSFSVRARFRRSAASWARATDRASDLEPAAAPGALLDPEEARSPLSGSLSANTPPADAALMVYAVPSSDAKALPAPPCLAEPSAEPSSSPVRPPAGPSSSAPSAASAAAAEA
mmetsp:Transcript_15298/g.57841  ORF Transcript_15298/g.57841 Transcript_15298/m.57841 type:complete len:267 (-) Transcript_15298:2509-3309(-)